MVDSEGGARGSDVRVCAHCGRPMRGFASADGRWLCHPDAGMDCYRLVTVYGHAVPCARCRRNLDDPQAFRDALHRRVWGEG